MNKRELINRQLYQELGQLSKQFWTDEEARLKVANDIYDKHKDDILSVEKELYDLRVELATDAAGKFLEAETKTTN